MKRARGEFGDYNREKNSEKKTSSGKVIYHCHFCKRICCTENNMNEHLKSHVTSTPSSSTSSPTNIV